VLQVFYSDISKKWLPEMNENKNKVIVGWANQRTAHTL
jgi:hypothetical protein